MGGAATTFRNCGCDQSDQAPLLSRARAATTYDVPAFNAPGIRQSVSPDSVAVDSQVSSTSPS